MLNLIVGDDRLLAEGVVDVATIDSKIYLSKILIDLERPHFDVLRRLVDVEHAHITVLATSISPRSYVDSVVATLVRTGLLRLVQQMLTPQYPRTYEADPEDPAVPKGDSFAITALGRSFLEWIGEVREPVGDRGRSTSQA